MKLSAKLLCLSTVCLLLMQVTPAFAAVRFYATASREYQRNWNNPAKRTIIAITSGWKHRASVSVQGTKNMPTVRVISGGTPDITYSIKEGEDDGDWFVNFESTLIWHQPHVLAVELDAGGARFPVKVKFQPNIKVKVVGSGVLSSQAWRGKLTLHTGYGVSSNPGGKAGHGFYLTFGGSIWTIKKNIDLVGEGNVNYSNYKLEYNTLGITEWGHVNSTEFQPRIGVRIKVPFNKKGLGLHITPFAGVVFRVVKHDNDVTGLSDDLRLHLIHGRLELNGGLALGVRLAFYFSYWFGISAELTWAGTWKTLKEIGDPIVTGFDSRFYGNFGVTGRF